MKAAHCSNDILGGFLQCVYNLFFASLQFLEQNWAHFLQRERQAVVNRNTFWIDRKSYEMSAASQVGRVCVDNSNALSFLPFQIRVGKAVRAVDVIKVFDSALIVQ